MKSNFEQRIILRLLLAIFLLNGFALLVFNRIDNIINVDLYKYGLIFDLDWATRYWNISYTYQTCLIVSIVMISLSIIALLSFAKTHQTSSKSAGLLSLTTGIAATVFAVYILSNIDYLVNYNLYHYGLQLNGAWITDYWTYIRLTFGFLISALVLSVIAVLVFIVEYKRSVRSNITKLTYLTVLTLGAMSLVVSIISTSSILAFIGLGLVFWGIIFAYVKTEEFVKKSLMDSTISSQQLTVAQVLQQLGCKGKPVQLPPRYFVNSEAIKVFIPEARESKLPRLELIQREGARFFVTNPSGVLLSPSGAGLAKIFEETLETNFNRVDTQYLENHLPKLIVESLEIAQAFKLEIKNKKIRVEIENSIYNVAGLKKQLSSDEYFAFTFPLSSAIAFAMAKATGQPIRTEKMQIDKEGKGLTVEYTIMDEESPQK